MVCLLNFFVLIVRAILIEMELWEFELLVAQCNIKTYRKINSKIYYSISYCKSLFYRYLSCFCTSRRDA